jgi:hypothetical protein
VVVQVLSLIFLPFAADTPSEAQPAQETMRNYLLRIKDELLWPRILVRNAPPPDELQPNAPDRS